MQESNSEKRTLILIGNGFDLSFDMKTSYKDFVMSDNFEQIVKKGSGLARYIYSKLQKNDHNWVDVEMELYNYSWVLAKEGNKNQIESSSKIFREEYWELTEVLNRYLLENTGGHDNGGMKSLIQEKWLLPDGHNNYKSDSFTVVSFNYTNQVTINFWNDNGVADIRYIHGRMDYNEKQAIVLGIDETQKVINEHSFLYKSMNKHTVAIGYNNLVKNANRIIIYGCSIGETDYFYFSTLFKGSKNKQFDIYFFKESGKEDIIKRVKYCVGDYATFEDSNIVLYHNCEQYNMAPKVKSKHDLTLM